MTDKIVKTWRAGLEDRTILKALKNAKIGKTESDRIRAGIRALARERGVAVPHTAPIH